jgi:CRP/FNR family transcriptional regulator, cyclic AMP receptor protein
MTWNSGDQHATRSPWPARTQPRPSSYQYLLDLDVDLADELDVRMRMVARSAITAVTFDVDVGELKLSEWLSLAARGPGVLVLDGVVAVNICVGDRIAAELIGGGDLVQPLRAEDEELLECDVGWRALAPSRFALLDAAFAQRVQPWPQITQALLWRAARRTRRLGAQRAIAAQPRLEVRLALLLWHLAARWGKVEPGGIRLPIPLTHQLLGRLIGAERPSVSHALARLAHAGLVSGHGDEWHLHGSLDEQLASMIEPSPDRVQRLATSTAAVRPR